MSRRSHRVGILAAVGTALLLAGPAAAQEPDPPPERPDSSEAGPETVLEKLEAGQRLRVQLMAGERREGRLRALRDGRLVLEDGGRRQLPLDRVGVVWTRGSRVKLGAIVGGSAGFAVGSLLGAVAGTIACSETGGGCALEGALAGGGLVGAGMAGLGAVVGLLIPRWKQRWP